MSAVTTGPNPEAQNLEQTKPPAELTKTAALGLTEGTTKGSGRTPRKLDGTRVELPKEFVAHLVKKQQAFKKRAGKEISLAVLILASYSEVQGDAYLDDEAVKLTPWRKKKGANDGPAN